MGDQISKEIEEHLKITTYTFQQLSEMTMAELWEIKKEKQQELYNLQKEKAALCANIISLQGMIQIECERKVEEEGHIPPIPKEPEQLNIDTTIVDSDGETLVEIDGDVDEETGFDLSKDDIDHLMMDDSFDDDDPLETILKDANDDPLGENVDHPDNKSMKGHDERTNSNNQTSNNGT